MLILVAESPSDSAVQQPEVLLIVVAEGDMAGLGLAVGMGQGVEDEDTGIAFFGPNRHFEG